jgi:fatty-acyl-CoA synthase
MDPELFLAQTRRRIAQAATDFLLVEAGMAGSVQAPEGCRVLTLEAGGPGAAATEGGEGEPVPAAARPGGRPHSAIVQFTSGSTAEPKPALIAHAALRHNVRGFLTRMGIRPESDVAVSWLPLYHDMGLIGMLTGAMASGMDLVLWDPLSFAASPGTWLRLIEQYRGTVVCAPNFAYGLAGRLLRLPQEYDLSSLRMCINGAEPIDGATMRGFVEAGRRHGVAPDAVQCVYGLAEAVLAVTSPVPGRGLRTVTVSGKELGQGAVAQPVDAADARELVLLGHPLDGLELQLRAPSGEPVGDGAVGEVHIRGASTISGYLADDDTIRPAVGADGWLATGDVGLLVAGELAVCGRLKDVIIIGGRNHYPSEFELAASEVPGVRRGNVAAFGVARDARERLVIACEVREEGAEPRAAIRRQVADTVQERTGVPVADVLLLGRGELPKTSSGKLRRAATRDLYLSAAATEEPSA